MIWIELLEKHLKLETLVFTKSDVDSMNRCVAGIRESIRQEGIELSVIKAEIQQLKTDGRLKALHFRRLVKMASKPNDNQTIT